MLQSCMQEAQRSGKAGEVLHKWRALSMECRAAEKACQGA